MSRIVNDQNHPPIMDNESFWISEDGVISSVKGRPKSKVLDLTVTFRLNKKAEIEWARSRLKKIQFTERSSLARIGLEIASKRPPSLNRDRLILSCEAFLYDGSFPCASYYKELLKPGTSAGRLFYAPESQKLSADEIWQALDKNLIKLPITTSIDRFGRVFLTPHKVRYTRPQTISKLDHLRLIEGYYPRSFLDKVQIRTDIGVVDIEPHSGLLTSCSVYLKDHYIVLNRGEGNFGLHSGAVLLDPVKTSGTNIILEIYNRNDQPVINPVVSVEVYHSPTFDKAQKEALKAKNEKLYVNLKQVYQQLDENPKAHFSSVRPTTRVSVSGRRAQMPNQSLLIRPLDEIGGEIRRIGANEHFGYRTIGQAIRKGDADSDTLVMDHFPSLPEHIEILARFQRLKLKRLVFRKATPMQDFFLPSEAQSMLDTYEQLGLKLFWYNEYINDIFVHAYKNDHGYFIKEENVDRFLACTILAFYGSALEMSAEERRNITALVERMTQFFGPNVGILTGGGEGVMGLAADVGRSNNCLTGAAYLELEAQPPKVGVDFFNTFQERNRHNRQKWFQVADFCIFSLGGAGTMEEIGIELCNLKLGIRPRVPYVFFHPKYFKNLKSQFRLMVEKERMPAWIEDYLLFSGDPAEIIEFYRKTLQIL